jgi:hypothetical protein
MAGSGYECDSPTRAAFQEMDSHFQTILYKQWFQNELFPFLHKTLASNEDDFVIDLKQLRVWYGQAGAYWCRPGELKKYITLILTYQDITIAYEQDSLDDTCGYVRLFRPVM